MDYEQAIERLRMVAEDAARDASNLDGKPFTGKSVGETFGFAFAEIATIADTLSELLAELNRKDAENNPANASLIVAACNSYQRHFADPVAAAEADVLGEAIRIIQRFYRVAELLTAFRIGDGADAMESARQFFAHTTAVAKRKDIKETEP